MAKGKKKQRPQQAAQTSRRNVGRINAVVQPQSHNAN
jgi:hypothetical protein